MESPPAKTQQQINSNSSPQAKSPVKTEVAIKKQKKKKQKALKEFLQAKQENDIIDLPKKAEQQPQQPQPPATNCKICGDLSEKKKQCQFCKDVVCMTHIRKKRKNKQTNKFARICDDCEDKQLHDKYMKLQTKAEQAVVMQQMIVQAKHDQLAELAAAKQVRITLLQSKKKQLEDEKKQYAHKIRIAENDIQNKLKKFENKLVEIKVMEQEICKLEQSLPRPLDDDYNCLLDQNSKINKELLKFQKLCSEALKAKSIREKELYDMYYKWEKKETVKTTTAKKEDCYIY